MTPVLQDSSQHHADRVRMSGATLEEGGRVHGERSEKGVRETNTLSVTRQTACVQSLHGDGEPAVLQNGPDRVDLRGGIAEIDRRSH